MIDLSFFFPSSNIQFLATWDIMHHVPSRSRPSQTSMHTRPMTSALDGRTILRGSYIVPNKLLFCIPSYGAHEPSARTAIKIHPPPLPVIRWRPPQQSRGSSSLITTIKVKHHLHPSTASTLILLSPHKARSRRRSMTCLPLLETCPPAWTFLKKAQRAGVPIAPSLPVGPRSGGGQP